MFDNSIAMAFSKNETNSHLLTAAAMMCVTTGLEIRVKKDLISALAKCVAPPSIAVRTALMAAGTADGLSFFVLRFSRLLLPQSAETIWRLYVPPKGFDIHQDIQNSPLYDASLHRGKYDRTKSLGFLTMRIQLGNRYSQRLPELEPLTRQPKTQRADISANILGKIVDFFANSLRRRSASILLNDAPCVFNCLLLAEFFK
jgi:hypothetical protein